MSLDASMALIEGPWEHRFVAANGARFHVAEVGEGPLVLFLHGFPEFWWAWRHQLTAVADAGFRAAALDLRGSGASDKPPTGYDGWTAAADVSGVIRSLGVESAIVVGHGLGGFVAWSLPYLAPGVTRALGTVGMPHPCVFRRQVARNLTHLRSNSLLAGMQRPWVPEREMTSDLEAVPRVLRRWAAPASAWPSTEEGERYAEALTIPFAADAAADYHRWLVRSQLRREGWSYARRLSGRIDLPVLQIRGDQDATVSGIAQGASVAYVGGESTNVVVTDAGHFPHEEAPARLNRHLLTWLDGLTP
jgi:pimeloyl-ACP methyl ester carboxylesterase